MTQDAPEAGDTGLPTSPFRNPLASSRLAQLPAEPHYPILVLVAARLLGTVTTPEEAPSWGQRGFTSCLWGVASVCPQSPFLGLSASCVEPFPPQVWRPSPGSLAGRDPGQGVWL